MVSEGLGPDEKPRETKVAFILQTCALSARKEFEARFGLKVVGQCMQTAESRLTKEDLAGRDFWKEGLNWEDVAKPHAMSESAKRYFETKERAEKVQAAKRAAGIVSWDDATEEQLRKVDELLAEEKR